ncbi:MAG: DNA-3-methyladenine glycosylase I [Pseudomonadota bacterium]
MAGSTPAPAKTAKGAQAEKTAKGSPLDRAPVGERCPWPGIETPIYADYHDTEWGVPQVDSQKLFEKIVLEGFQSGLSWLTILKKREAFREAFDGFDPERVARYDANKLAKLITNTGIVRSQAKIASAVQNAQAYLKLSEQQPFAAYIWSFVDYSPITNAHRTFSDVPTETDESRALAKSLKANGFRFVGPTTMYAFMQSVGIVNDHLVTCPRYEECARLQREMVPPVGVPAKAAKEASARAGA